MSAHFTSTKFLHLASLWCAARLVPAPKRADWLREWTSELWYVHEACIPKRGISLQGEREVAAFCFGAFQDALCLLRNAPRHKPTGTHPLHSAVQCAFFLIFLVITTWCLALFLPGARTAIETPPFRDSSNLIILSEPGLSDSNLPSIRAEQYRSWRDRDQHLFSDFAFYQTSVKLLHTGPHTASELNIACSSANLFALTGLPLFFATSTRDVSDGLAKLVLTEKLWRASFHSDPHISGRLLKLGLRPVKDEGACTARPIPAMIASS